MKSSTRRNPTMILRRTMTGEPSDISGNGRGFSDIGVDPDLLFWPFSLQSTQLFSHLILAPWCDDEVDQYPVPWNNKIWLGVRAWHLWRLFVRGTFEGVSNSEIVVIWPIGRNLWQEAIVVFVVWQTVLFSEMLYSTGGYWRLFLRSVTLLSIHTTHYGAILVSWCLPESLSRLQYSKNFYWNN